MTTQKNQQRSSALTFMLLWYRLYKILDYSTRFENGNSDINIVHERWAVQTMAQPDKCSFSLPV